MKRLIDPARANPGIALTICGLLAFAYLRFAYLLFYSPLHVSPDDVGLGYKETIVGAVTVVLSVMLFAAGFIIAGLMLFAVLSLARKTEKSVLAFALDGIFTVILVWLGFQLWLLHDAGRDVLEGKANTWVVFGIPLYQAHAEYAEASSDSSLPETVRAELRSSCLLYLGAANGTTVIYDASRDRALHLPSSLIAVSVDAKPTPNCERKTNPKAALASAARAAAATSPGEPTELGTEDAAETPRATRGLSDTARLR